MILFYDFNTLIYVLPILLISFTMHEVAHSYAAYKQGDYTQKEKGRLSFNPLKHIDIYGFLLILIAGFGWAKPVEVDASNFKDYKTSMFITAICGPLSNLVLAFFAIIFQIINAKYIGSNVLDLICLYTWMINISLGLFNLIPLPPLDGSKLLIKVMDTESYEAYQSHTMVSFVLLLVILFTDMFSMLLNSIYSYIIDFIINSVI